MVTTSPYGTWRSPVTAQDAARAVGLCTVAVGPRGTVWWEEVRPEEDGRSAIMCGTPYGTPSEVVGAELDALGVHHGIGSWLPVGPEAVVVAHGDGLHLLQPGKQARSLTPVSPGRYLDLVAGPDGRQVWGVREWHSHGATQRGIVAVPLDGSSPVRTLVVTPEFVATPRPSPEGTWLAWITWESPQMPWDGSRLRVGQVNSGGVTEVRTLLGGVSESVFQPEWATPDALYAVSDRSRWWNPYQVGLDGMLRPLSPWSEEFGWPQWRDGLATYGRIADGRLAVLHGTGDWRLDLLHPADGTLAPLNLPYTSWQPTLRTDGTVIAGVAGSPWHAAAVVAVHATGGQHRVLRRSAPAPPREYLAPGRWTRFAGQNGHEVHALIHPPCNPNFRAPERERAPYLLFLHDFPTARAMHALDLSTVFFTSRGLGVAEIVCRGSCGFGRGYREQVYGRWGVADVEDCVVVGRGLVHRHGADPARLAVRGVGAGGATALGVLAHTNQCAAGTIYAGITDLQLLTGDHPAVAHLRAVAADSTLQRDPSWLDSIRDPVLLLHGARDDIVPPSQSWLLRQALRRTNVPHTCLVFDEEGHQFRRADSLSRALDTELAFYQQVFGLTPTNLPTPSTRIHGDTQAPGHT